MYFMTQTYENQKKKKTKAINPPTSGSQIAKARLPKRRCRCYQRAVKRKMSKYPICRTREKMNTYQKIIVKITKPLK